jgi:large subunit ribosomal protein L23
MNIYEVLRQPVITEKSTYLQEQNKYVFEVALTANKVQVRQAVEKVFGVKVLSVNMVIKPGKQKRYGVKLYMTPRRKKAIVKLRSGDRIEFFEGA